LRLDREVYFYAGHKIHIVEALDSYGGVIWPAALALCNYLETNTDVIDLRRKAGSGAGIRDRLVSVAASLLGAQVTATDLPDVLSNLRYNLLRNTRGRSKYTPEVTALAWGPGVEQHLPQIHLSLHDYVLAADVVYHHDLEELLFTMRYFCRPGTTLIWANKVRLKTNLGFTEDFKKTFNTTLLAEMGEVKIFKATCKR
ncbi:protein-lysine methyltransferase METTL21C-like, partial [Coregonus clupeaformis]|uniref:protein-lysine methyltransferase METTL21C-like n=1 Tax=Coregonus clupeaformis TaxID=59861 RepID=UPI001E1C38C0